MSDESNWTSPGSLPEAGGDCHDPAIAVAGDVIHFVWAHDRLLHHAQLIGDRWQPVTRFAAGEQPVLSADPDGILHCIFANWFLGNCEIHHITFDGVRWGFAEWVSRTPGVSRQPALAWTHSGEAQIVWSEETPSGPLIYYAGRGRVAWLHAPIPNATGSQPSLAITAAGEIFVAWQARLLRNEGGALVTGPHQVLCAGLKNGVWSLPEIISQNPAVEAVAPMLAAGPDGSVHIVWQEARGDQYIIQHATRLAQGWSQSSTLSELGADSRLPRVFAHASGVHVIWVEDSAIRRRRRELAADGAWSAVENVGQAPDLSEMVAALGESGNLCIAWSAYEAGTRRAIRYTKSEVLLKNKVYLPFTPGGK